MMEDVASPHPPHSNSIQPLGWVRGVRYGYGTGTGAGGVRVYGTERGFYKNPVVRTHRTVFPCCAHVAAVHRPLNSRTSPLSLSCLRVS
jgi:hypothetical protein